MFPDKWTGWVIDVLCLIQCSRQGLTSAELLDILYYMGYGYSEGSVAITAFDLALLRSAAGDVISERQGGALVLADDDLVNVIVLFMQGQYLSVYTRISTKVIHPMVG